jgi:hypothetical protein
MSIESKVTDDDWEDIKESEFVDVAEGISSYALIFKHEEIGLHGLQLKKTNDKAVLYAKSFSKQSENCEES